MKKISRDRNSQNFVGPDLPGSDSGKKWSVRQFRVASFWKYNLYDNCRQHFNFCSSTGHGFLVVFVISMDIILNREVLMK